MTWENEGSSIGYSALQSPLFIHLCLPCLASCLPSCLPKSGALQLRSSAGGEARCGRSAEVEVWRGRVGGEEGRGGERGRGIGPNAPSSDEPTPLPTPWGSSWALVGNRPGRRISAPRSSDNAPNHTPVAGSSCLGEPVRGQEGGKPRQTTIGIVKSWNWLLHLNR